LTAGGEGEPWSEHVATVPGGLVALTDDFNIQTYRADDPLHPALAGVLDLGDWTWTWELVTARIHDRWEAMIGCERGVYRIDVTDLDAPTVLSVLPYPAESIAVDDTVAFLGYWGLIEARGLGRDGGFTLIDSVFTPNGPYTHGLATRNGRVYASLRTQTESRFAVYSWSYSAGFRLEDAVPVSGHTSSAGPVLLPGQRVLAPLTGGLHQIWDRGAQSLAPLVGPATEVYAPGAH